MSHNPVRREAARSEIGGQPAFADNGGFGTSDELPAEHIRELEAQYRAVFEATTDGLVINDLETGVIVEANPAFCRMHGYTHDEMVGMHPTKHIRPDYHHLFGEYVRTVRRGDTFHTQAVDIRKDGAEFHVAVSGRAFRFFGKPSVLGIVRDITERVRAYELLEQRVEERTRELSTLLDISRNVTSTLEVRRLLDLILDQLKSIAEYHGAGIVQLVGDELRVIGYRGPIPQEIALQTTFPAHSLPVWDYLTRGEPIVIRDVRGDDPLARAYQEASGERLETVYAHVRCFLAVPMTLKGQVIGALTLEHSLPGYYTDEHLALAMAVAQQAAIAIENARLYEQATWHTHELSTLLDIARNVTSTLELDRLLDLILEQLQSVVDYSGAGIVVREEDEVRIVRQRGPEPYTIPAETQIPMSEARPLWDLIAREPGVIIDDVQGDTAEARAYRDLVGPSMEEFPYIRSWMGVPMRIKDRQMGALFLAHSDTGTYSMHHANLALAIAQQAAIAIENARLYEQAQEVAVIEERQRLSRELHDSVSQALYGIALGAQTARALAQRDPSQVVQALDYVLSLAQTGMAEMRSLIFELRPEMLAQEGLAAGLQRQADAITARHRIRVTTALGDEPEASLATKETLYRIAQEALHNAIKHAEASEIRLSLGRAGSEIVLGIQDDGKGFDTSGSFPGHLGLHSMRERAQRFGGTLDIDSTIGTGTTITVRIPGGSGAR